MKISDLTVEVRNSSLARVGQILPADLIGFEAALRFNKVGSWKVTLRSDHPLVDTLRSPGSGIIVTGPTGVLLSGPTASAKNTKTADDPTGVWEIVGTDDGVILGERLAYPVPASSSLASQTVAYDTRSDKAETVAKAYVNANIGPSAPVARRITALTIDTDLARGSTVVANARFDKLGELIASLLVIDGLGFDIRQSGANLVFEVYQPVDRSASIRMDVDNLRLEKSEYSYQRPEATRVIVAGQGQGGERTFIERSSASSTTAESAWGRRIEVFKDSRNTNDTTALQTAGDEILAAGGKTIEGIRVTPSDDQTMRYGVDWGLGDKVTVVVGSTQVAQIVTEVAIVVTDNGIKFGATVGEPGVLEDYEASLLSASTDQSARITALEVNESAGGINASSITTGTLDPNRLPTIPASKIADGSLSNAKLTNSSIQWNGSAVALGDTLTVPVSQNFLINGAFDVWQRGTSFVNSGATAYVADRWNNANNAFGSHTITRQTTGVPVASQYCMRTATTAATSYASKAQLIETNNVRPLLGKTVIFSVKLRRNSSFSANLAVEILKSSTVDAAINGTFSSVVSTTVANASLPTGTSSSDWFTASVTATIPSDGTANTLQVRVRETSAQGNGAYWEMAEAQLELGSVVTPFRRNALTIQAEIAECQRYYTRFDAASAGRFGVVGASTATQAFAAIPLPVSMRAINSVAYSNMQLTTFSASALGAITAIVLAELPGASLASLNITASSMTANTAYFLRASSAGFIAFDGEL